MSRTKTYLSLGALVAMTAAPRTMTAQLITRGTGSSAGTLTAPRPSSLPPIRMGSLPQSGGTPQSWRDARHFDRGFGLGPIRCVDGSLRCSGKVAYARGAFARIPYQVQTIIPFEVPVYVPVPVWVPAPRPPKAPDKPHDPTKSRMTTIGAGADGGGGVMRIESVSDSVVRLTWLGTARPIREARLYLADSAQRPLRSALVDDDTPSALFKIADVAPRIAYYGLTISFANGAIETTLVPYIRPDPDVR